MALYNSNGQQIQVKRNESIPQNALRTLREKLDPLPVKGDKMFRLETRAH